MWTEFEWENRVNVNNSMSSVLDPCVSCHLHPHVRHRAFSGILETICIMLWKLRICHALLQKVQHQENVISFQRICMLEVFSVSFFFIWRFDVLLKENYSYSFFFFSGEDALANLSIERTEAGTITGHVRIRSKTQGIALSLGDKITMGMSFFFSLYIVKDWLFKTSPAQRDEKPLSV